MVASDPTFKIQSIHNIVPEQTEEHRIRVQPTREGSPPEKPTMVRDKYNDASTGPDTYFDKALQYPEFSSPSFSFPTKGNNYKFVLLPSSMKRTYDDGHARPTLSYHPWSQAHKDRRYSPVHSPGSNATSRTSLCSTDDYDVDDDLSHCGSLTYSVESWTIGPYTSEDIDEGYHAEDEETTCTAEAIRSSAYDLDQDDADCFAVDICFQPLDWVNTLMKDIFQALGGIPQDNESRRRLQPQRHRYDAHVSL